MKKNRKRIGMINAVGLVATKVLLDRKCTSVQHTMKGRELADAIREEWSDPSRQLTDNNSTIEGYLSQAASGIFKDKIMCRGPHAGYYYNQERENLAEDSDASQQYNCDSTISKQESNSTCQSRHDENSSHSGGSHQDEKILKCESYLYEIIIAYMQNILGFGIAVDISNRRLNGKHENSDVLAASYHNIFGEVEIDTALVEVKASVAGYFDALDAAGKQRNFCHQVWVAWRDPECTVSSLQPNMVRKAGDIGLIEIRLNDDELIAFAKKKKPLSEVLAKISIVNNPTRNNPLSERVKRLLDAGRLELGFVEIKATKGGH